MGQLEFLFTGDVQDWTVPAGVTVVDIVVGGANQPLLGQVIEAVFAVTPGEVLHLYVGGPPDVAGSGGWNGGGNGAMLPDTFTSSAGFGASDVRRGGTDLANRILVAGGGTGIGWDNRGESPGFGVGDFGEIDPLYGYSIRTSMPGPGDAPRVKRSPNPILGTTYEYIDGGAPGGDAVGADSLIGADYATGAGGGGAGGGAAGARYLVHSEDESIDGREIWAGGNTGGWYSAPGIGAFAGSRLRDYIGFPSEDYSGGGIRVSWGDALQRGWSTGHKRF